MARFEVKGPDGKRYEIQAPDQASAMAAFTKFTAGNATPAAAPAYDEGGVGGRINNVADAIANGATFGFGDEIGARLNSWTGYNTETGSYDGNRTYDQELEAIRQRRAGFKAADPVPAFAAELLGGAAPAAAGVGVVSGGGSLAARMGRGAATGAGLGAAYGFGEGEGGLANRAQSGLLSGLVGGAVGGAIPAVADAGRSLYRMGQEAYRNSSIGNQIGNQLGVSPQAGRFIGEAISAENPADMAAALGRAGPDAMLADASPALAGRLDATMRSPVAGAGLARQRVDDRAGAAYGNIMEALDPGGLTQRSVGSQIDNIRASTAAARGEAYQRAFGQEIDWRSPAGDRLRQLIESTPDSVLQKSRREIAMRPNIAQSSIPDSAYASEFADTVSRPSGPASWLTQEQNEIDQFFEAYNAMSGRPVARRPVTNAIKAAGGVDPRSAAGRELKAMGLTSRNSPGLFRNGGLQDVDNLRPDMFPGTVRSAGDGTGNYMDRNSLLGMIRDEWNGTTATRSVDDAFDASQAQYMERLIPEYEARQAALDQIAAGPTAPAIVGDLVPTRTVEDIDQIKRTLDNIRRESQDIRGVPSGEGMAAGDRATAIRDALIEAAPGYDDALSLGRDAIRQREMVQYGSEILRPNVTVDDALRAVSRASPAEMTRMRQGLIGQMRHIIGNVRAIATDQNIEPRQAMQALRELSSPNSQAKLEAVYGDAWPSIKQSIDRASAALGLRASTSANSATAARQFADREITEAVTPGAIARMKPFEAASDIAAGVLGYSPQAINRMRDEVKAEIADILTRQGGVPRSTIQRVMAVMNRNPSNPNAGNALRKIITGSGLASIPGLSEALTRLERPLP